MSDKKTDYTFEFSPAYQEAIVGHCLIDAKFFHRCMNKIKPEWFSCSPTVVTIYTQLVKFYEKHGYAPKSTPVDGVPMPEEMLNEPWFQQQTPQEMAKMRDAITRCIASRSGAFSLETIQKNMTGWLRKKLLMETYQTGVTKFNKDGHEDSYEWTAKRIKEIAGASFFDEFKTESFEGSVEFFQKTDPKSRSISTGCKLLDMSLGGGLFKGETCAIVAPTNSGKSRALMTIARHAVVNGSKVLFISHEDNAQKIKERMLSSVIGMQPKVIRSAIAMERVNVEANLDQNGNYPVLADEYVTKLNLYAINQLTLAESLLKEKMVYLPYIRTGKMYAENLIEEIQRLQENEILSTGRGFDMVVDDYPKKLKLKNRGKENLYRAELAEIYDMFNQLAIEMDVHCLVAIQTNRVGAQMNKGRVETDSYLGNEEVDESYGIAQNMGCMITLNRSDADKNFNILHYNISKSRNDRNDISVTTRTNYGANLLHGDWTMFQKYGTIMLTRPLAADGDTTNKKKEALEADRLLKETEAQVKAAINGYLEINKELAWSLPILGK